MDEQPGGGRVRCRASRNRQLSLAGGLIHAECGSVTLTDMRSIPLPVSQTQAAILVDSNSQLEVSQIELPTELRFGQVLVEVHYSGVCSSQLGEIAAVKGPDRYLPHLLGHEASATVLAIGEGVKTVEVGDNVVMHWRPGSGLQAESPTYGWGGRRVNAGAVTTFNRHAVASENRLTPAPGELDPRLVPLLGCAITTGFGVVTNDAAVRIGESVVVFGTGGVGLSVILAARMVSAYPIIGIDLTEDKLDAARRLGATHTFLSADREALSTAIHETLGSLGADVVVDTTGNVDVIQQANDLTNSAGRTILVGVPKGGQRASISTLPLHFGKILTGSHGGGSKPDEDIPRLVRLIGAGHLDLNQFPTYEYELAEINQALQDLRDGAVGRRIIRMPDE